MNLTYKSGAILATLIFIIAKLNGTVDWDWWTVTSPAWGYFLLMLPLALIKMLLESIAEVIAKREKKKERTTHERVQN